MFDFNNYIMKTISKSPIRHVVRLQRKLKLKILLFVCFIIFFKIPLY